MFMDAVNYALSADAVADADFVEGVLIAEEAYVGLAEPTGRMVTCECTNVSIIKGGTLYLIYPVTIGITNVSPEGEGI